MRESFIPPAVLPLEPPTAIRIARIRIAPEENTVRTWLVVTTEKPVVLEAEMSMNTPRRIIVSRSEKSGVVERVAMKMMHMNTSQKNPVRISKSLKKRSVFPRSTATEQPEIDHAEQHQEHTGDLKEIGMVIHDGLAGGREACGHEA